MLIKKIHRETKSNAERSDTKFYLFSGQLVIGKDPQYRILEQQVFGSKRKSDKDKPAHKKSEHSAKNERTPLLA